mmetsp:Transcript_46119/g.107739  ORF Transcript_46119/g.107739 Transcript_46119/m.107739 type:complete len:279 (+) Transcript_46119:27-863(+)
MWSAIVWSAALAGAADLSAFRQTSLGALRTELLGSTAATRVRFLEGELQRTASSSAQLGTKLAELREEAEEQAELLSMGDERSAVLQKLVTEGRAKLAPVKAKCATLASELELASSRCAEIDVKLALATDTQRVQGVQLERAENEVQELTELKGQMMRQLSQADTATAEKLKTLKEQCSTLASELEIATDDAEHLRNELAKALVAKDELVAVTARAEKLQRKVDQAAPAAAKLKTMKEQCSTLASELELATGEAERLRAFLAETRVAETDVESSSSTA